jgi:hypothetical protein
MVDNSGEQYYVVVTNVLSSATSAIATITVPQVQFNSPMLFNGSNVVLNWSGGGILQSATNVTGPWTVATNAKSPWTNLIVPDVSQQFFRVQH